jgi:hypothetical protein
MSETSPEENAIRMGSSSRLDFLNNDGHILPCQRYPVINAECLWTGSWVVQTETTTYHTETKAASRDPFSQHPHLHNTKERIHLAFWVEAVTQISPQASLRANGGRGGRCEPVARLATSSGGGSSKMHSVLINSGLREAVISTACRPMDSEHSPWKPDSPLLAGLYGWWGR